MHDAYIEHNSSTHDTHSLILFLFSVVHHACVSIPQSLAHFIPQIHTIRYCFFYDFKLFVHPNAIMQPFSTVGIT
jgi:hypothetical protein